MGFPGQSSKCAENNLRIVWFCSLSIPVQSFSQILGNGPMFLQPAWDVPSRVLGDLTVLEVAWWAEQQTEYWSGTSGSKPRCWEQLMIGGIPFFHYWIIAIHHNSNSISFDQSGGRGLLLLDSCEGVRRSTLLARLPSCPSGPLGPKACKGLSLDRNQAIQSSRVHHKCLWK